MKIEFFRAENFIGIYNGTGRTVIEIDFSKNLNRLILLAGGNGSGKTTLASILHPFADTLDSRSNIILNGKNGFKEIRIRHNDKLYRIQHFYNNKTKTKTIKSFIAEWDGFDWIEMNDNGTVNSFKKLVSEVLDVNESFFKLSRIGKNVTNFVDLKPAERKKFISNFLPNIEEYLYHYKIVNDKWSTIRKDIKTVAEQIGKLDNDENLQTLLINTQNQINNRENKKQKYLAEINENKGKISHLDKDNLISEKHNSLTKRKDKLDVDINTIEGKIENILSKNPKLAKYNEVEQIERIIYNLEQKVTIVINDISNHQTNKDKVVKEISQLSNDLYEKKLQLSKYNTDKNLDEYKELKVNYDNRIDEIEKDLTDYEGFEEYIDLSTDLLDTYNILMNNIIKRITDISPKYYLNDMLDVINSKLNINDYSTEVKSLSNVRRKEKNAIRDIENEIQFFKGKSSQLEILEKRPNECGIDTCPFIVEALKYSKSQVKIDELDGILELKKVNLEKIEKQIEKAESSVLIYKDVQSVWKLITENISLINKFPRCEDLNTWESFKQFFSRDKNKYQDTTDLNDFLWLNKELNEINNVKLPDILRNIEILESKTELINSLKNDLSKIDKSIIDKNTELLEFKELINDLNKSKEASNNLLSRLNDYLKVKKEYKDSTNEMNQVKDNINEISDVISEIRLLKEDNKELLEEVNFLNDELEPLDKELDSVKFNIKKLKEFTERKKNLDEKYTKINIVKDALSPTKGIPLLFIDIYLKKTKSIANNLLDIAFKGKFIIEDFILNEKDFLISAKKENSQMLDDISEASQGEISLSSLSLSLALIQQSLSKYNILVFDELDSELDEKNRRAFVEMLENQLDILGVEQGYIISHNKEFDNYPVDLILMPDHSIDIHDKEFMSNKNILFNA